MGRPGLAAGGPGSLPSPHTHADPPPALTLSECVGSYRQAHACVSLDPVSILYEDLSVPLSACVCPSVSGAEINGAPGQFLFHELASQLSIPTGENQPERDARTVGKQRGWGQAAARGGVPAGLASSCRLSWWSCPGSSRQPIWSRSRREVGAGRGPLLTGQP